MSSLPNQRRHERFVAEVPCRVVVPGTKGPRFEAFVRTRDLSFGGAFLQTAFQFKSSDGQGPAVVVELRLPDELVAMKGRVVRKVDGGMGIAFEDVTPKQREAVLRHFIPAEHRAFHKDNAMELPVEKLSLILHQWDEWRSERAARQ